MRGEDDESTRGGRARHVRRHDHRSRSRCDEAAPRRSCATASPLGRRAQAKVTATFFNANYMNKDLTKGTKVMLSGEVGFFNGDMQLTHPAFLILDSPDGSNSGTRSLKNDRRRLGRDQRRRAAGRLRTRLLPDLSGQHQGAELGHLRVRAPGARRARPGPRSAAGIDSARNRPGLRRRGVARHPSRRERAASAQRARERLTFDEAVGLQWALVARRHGELCESGPPAPPRAGRAGRRTVAAACRSS